MNRWIKAEKRLPNDDRQVFALSGQCAYLAFYCEGAWWITNTIKLGGVTRWMDIPGEPKDFTYWWKRLREWWDRRKGNAQQASDWLTGWTSHNAQLDKKPIFYRDASGKIMTGMPENVPTPRGLERIVCGSALEAEKYSALQRKQDAIDHRRQQEDRGRVEDAQLGEIRRDRRTLIENARNNFNRDFLIAANERGDKQHKPWQYERESFLHSEAYESRR